MVKDHKTTIFFFGTLPLVTGRSSYSLSTLHTHINCNDLTQFDVSPILLVSSKFEQTVTRQYISTLVV